VKIGEYYEVVDFYGQPFCVKTTKRLERYGAGECSVLSGADLDFYYLPFPETNDEEILKKFDVKSYRKMTKQEIVQLLLEV
jgi:hypothetical protein